MQDHAVPIIGDPSGLLGTFGSRGDESCSSRPVPRSGDCSPLEKSKLVSKSSSSSAKAKLRALARWPVGSWAYLEEEIKKYKIKNKKKKQNRQQRNRIKIKRKQEK
jgi:hypothetical protein